MWVDGKKIKLPQVTRVVNTNNLLRHWCSGNMRVLQVCRSTPMPPTYKYFMFNAVKEIIWHLTCTKCNNCPIMQLWRTSYA